MKIYTRTGDTGETSLFDGTRVRKDDARVDTYGDVDELNAWLGFARAAGVDAAIDPPPVESASEHGGAPQEEQGGAPGESSTLARIQQDLFALGAQIADPADKIAARVTKAALGEADVERLERIIDRLEEGVPPLRRFILPGGGPGGAALHVARTVCRRAERRMVSLEPPVDAVLLRYVNRLSDLLFVMARAANHHGRVPETEW